MAEQSGFFNANLVNGEFDRVYLAEHFAKYFASFIGNGVFGGKSNELMVAQPTNSGMKVEVMSGMGWINGFWYENTSNLSLDISVADGVLNRIDNIVIRFGKTEREIKAYVVRGIPASVAVAPIVQRNSDYYELKLAEVNVKAGTTNITQAEIKDTRLNSEVCGFVVGLLQQFDTTEFGKQLDSYISNYANQFKMFLEELELNSVSELSFLFNKLNALAKDESAITALALDVYNNASNIDSVKQALGYEKKNLIPFPFFESFSKISNGITWTNNNDGTITANGTATEDSYFFLHKGNNFFAPGSYHITSGVDDKAKTYFAYCLITNKETGVVVRDVGRSYNTSPFEITKSEIQNHDLLIGISVLKGTTVSNVIFKPMIRRANIIDTTWEPYKLSVYELLNTSNKPGVEYLLAERWNDKPVYQKTFYVASLPINAIMTIQTDTEWDKVVSVSGYALDTDDLTYYPFPIILHNQIAPIAVISRVESDGSVVIATNGDASYFNAYITVKYTK